jgi:hypothetical protein
MICSTKRYIALQDNYYGAKLIRDTDRDYVWVLRRYDNRIWYRKFYIWDWEQKLLSCPVTLNLVQWDEEKQNLVKL